MADRTRLLPEQLDPIEGDLVFKQGLGGTRTVKIAQSIQGDGEDATYQAGDAATGSGANGGDTIVGGNAGDGAGLKGRLRPPLTAIVLDKINPATVKPRGVTQIAEYAGDDAGDTEYFLDTPGGVIQVTKDGQLNFAAAVPTIIASEAVDLMTTVAGGVGDPSQVQFGSYKAVSYPAAINTEARSQFTVPIEYRASLGDTVDVILKYAVTAGVNTNVRLTTYGASDTNTLAAQNFDVDVTAAAASPGDIFTTLVIRSVPVPTAIKHSTISLIIRRTTFVGEFTGAFQLVSVAYRFRSVNAVAAASISTDVFVSTALPSPVPGNMGSFKTNDYPPGATREAEFYFTVPQHYATGTDIFMRCVYAMSSAALQRVDLSTTGSVNNITTIPAQGFQLFPPATANVVQVSPPVRFFTGLVGQLDSLAVKFSRLIGDTHIGSFRLIGIILDFGAALLPGSILPPETEIQSSDVFGGVGPPTTDRLSVLGEGEAYNTAFGLANNQDATFVYRCRVASNVNGIGFIKVTHKVSAAVGNNGVVVSIRRASGAVVYTSLTQVSATRAELTIYPGDLSSQPLPGERFLVLAQAIVDNGSTTFVGTTVTVGYA